jgi:pimeloyl-ACP methyl ester carboxylesterase
MSILKRYFVYLSALALGSCAQYGKVSLRQPPLPATHVVATQGTLTDASKLENREPLRALSEYLMVAQNAAARLQRAPNDRRARDTYNFAVARVFDTLKKGRLDPWAQPLRVPAPGGNYLLTRKADPRREWNPALYDLTPADEFDVGGIYVKERQTKEGLGAPVVAVGSDVRENAVAQFATPRAYYCVTAIIRFEGHRAVIDFEDPLALETITMGGHTYPLAADFTVPLAVMLQRENPKRLEISRLLFPAKYAATAKIVRLQPYDPAKTVVLVVHGLKDSPATWTPLINTLRADPVIRQHYQFWYYSYPSGYPYPYSAAIMRAQLDAIEQRYPLKGKIVLIGHSMGGMICRLMITDAGDKLWRLYFGKRPANTALPELSRDMIEEATIFNHRSEVGRVIFMSTPHQGSDLASNWIGRIASSLIRPPRLLASIGANVFSIVTADPSALKLKRIPNSIDTLAPNNRFVRAVNKIPITPGIPYHSIIGDRGRGDSPKSSDGVVAYWSSHLDGAESEKIVPSGHGSPQNPAAIAEVDRILRLNLKQE